VSSYLGLSPNDLTVSASSGSLSSATSGSISYQASKVVRSSSLHELYSDPYGGVALSLLASDDPALSAVREQAARAPARTEGEWGIVERSTSWDVAEVRECVKEDFKYLVEEGVLEAGQEAEWEKLVWHCRDRGEIYGDSFGLCLIKSLSLGYGSSYQGSSKFSKGLLFGGQVLVSCPPGPLGFGIDNLTPSECVVNHGTQPPSSTNVVDLTFSIDVDDPNYDDKEDILERAGLRLCETFETKPGFFSSPDESMLPFLRLVCLGEADSFLLEAVFRDEVWDFMKEPVSLNNEKLVCEAVMASCLSALKKFDSFTSPPSTPLEAMCETVRKAETPVLKGVLSYIEREMEGLDLKEYYQERRLKSLNLDSPWDPERDVTSDSMGDEDSGNWDW